MSQPQPPPPLATEWQTHAEKTNYRETPRYAETIDYCRRLAAASPLIRFESFGKSGEGRDLPLLIAAEESAFDPDSAKANGKPVILIQACIHSGEPDGKDAGLALLRDIAITRVHPDLLKRVVVLFIPIYNVDGHERSTPFNRINQNGPAEMGWRGTTTNQNLNRDYMKADTPETRAWLGLWNKWSPDLFIDCHVTDGADYSSHITYHFEHHQGIAPQVIAWERRVVEGKVHPATEAAGSVISWYLEFIDNRDLSKGMRDFNGSPRFSTGYVPQRNRPAILIETHMLKDYQPRVLGTYNFLRFILEEVNREPQELLSVGREADEQAINAGMSFNPERRHPLRFEIVEEPRPFVLKAVKYETEFSEISGDVRVVFGSEPLNVTVPMFDKFRVSCAASPPLFYIIPPQWQEPIEVLRHHGVQSRRTEEALTIAVESYRFSNVSWASAPFEGRFLSDFNTEKIFEQRTFPAGSVLVPLAQPLARVVMNLLEPDGPDSFVSWGFFSAIFEQKEYGESYVLEQLAREMLAENQGLRSEFERRIETDSAFATDPRKRLEFFYERSPYWDPHLNVYPVGRIVTPL